MPSETVVTGTDEYGNERYKALYEELMYDVGKLAAVEKSYLVLKPKVPLFINYTYSVSAVGEGSGTPLQYSCLENPMDERAW